MKRLFLSICFGALLLNNFAMANTALTVLLTVGEWIVKDSNKVYYIRIESKARSESSALNQALREAVERTVGALLLSKQEVKNNVITRDEILKHSSGYVESYKIISKENQGEYKKIVVDVWVTQSKIAEQLLLDPTPGTAIKGSQIDKTYGTYMEQTESASKILEGFISGFPSNAFEVGIKESFAQVNGGSLYLTVHGKVRLQDDYLAAMSELIARTGGVKITGAKSLLGFANVKIRQRTRWTSDEYNYSQYHIGKLIAAVGEPHSRELPVYKASITDYQGFTLFFGCYAMRSYQEQSPINNFFPHKNFDSVEMDGGHIEEFYLHIPVSRSYLDSVSRESLAQAENVKVEIVKAYECKK